jgi:acetyl esterase/lipase
VGDVDLKLNIYSPPGHKPGDRRPAIVFFFGGGWSGGTTTQFASHCQYLASRGMVAIAPEYRVHSVHKAQIADCVADAKSAMRWVRSHADKLGIDPDRIVSAGGSAGGHLAAAVATLPGLDDPQDDTRVSCRPQAMVLFNPVLDLTPTGYPAEAQKKLPQNIVDRMGADGKALSPQYHIEKKLPPTIIFHGKNDTTVPYAQMEKFTETMTKAGNRCELIGYEGQIHAFFNYRRGTNPYFKATVKSADEFLVSLGYLKGPDTIDEFLGSETVRDAPKK